jgi:uncharacterized damage-inducible protein DinB
VQDLFAYNAWANRTLFDALALLPAEAYFRDLQSSHGGIHGTLCHIVWVEQLYLNRWLRRPNPATPQGKDLASLALARARWEEIEGERAAWLAHLATPRLDELITVQPTTGGQYHHSLAEMCRHVVDHSSYHRGQIITLLRQLGVKPPSTGMIVYFRERSSPAL